MPELLVVADDLSGANDVGVHFAARGVGTRVIPHGAPPLRAAEDRPVLVVDTQSRHLPPAEAATRVAAVVTWGRAVGVRHFFKKTDSTLRGNVGAELEALRLASGVPLLAFVPALPAQGRTTRGGVQYLDGRPLHETELARDPLEPARESDVPSLLRRQAAVPVVSLGLDALRDAGGPPLPDEGILVLDAGSDDELRGGVRWLESRGLLRAVAGTAALAQQLAELLPWSRHAPPPALPRPSGPMLVVGGSLAPQARAQMDHAAGRGFASVLLPPAALSGSAPDAAARCVEEAARRLSRGEDVLLRSAAGPGDAELCLALGERMGLGERALHLRVAERLGSATARILARSAAGVVAVLGGDTLAGVVRALGAAGLTPLREILPGTVVATLDGRPSPLLVSRPGGFGDEGVLPQIRAALYPEGRS